MKRYINEFVKLKCAPDMLWLKERKKKYARKHYLKHRDEVIDKAKAYRLANREQIKIRRRKHYLENKETIIKGVKRYYVANREKVVGQKKEYYSTIKDGADYKEKRSNYHRWYAETYPERILERSKQYYIAHPEKSRARVAKRRAIKHSAPGDGVTSDDQQAILNQYGHKCLVCGGINKLEFDHVVPLSQGGAHDPSNIQLLCKKCNRKKGVSIIDYRPERRVVNE